MKKYILIIYFLFLNVNLVFGFQSESSIVKIDGSDIYLNWGSNDGIEPGIIFNAYRMTGMSHPATNEQMEIERDLVGSIMVTDIFPEYSIGKVISKRQNPKVGDYLELVINFSDKEIVTTNKKGIIISIDGGKVEVNVGKNDGIQQGLIFDVMREEVLAHPVTGELLDKRNILVGKISIESVKGVTSVGDVIAGWEDIKVNDNIVLSEAQRSDMGIDRLTEEKEQNAVQEGKISEMELEKLISPGESKDFLGKIVNVDNKARQAVFSIESGYDKRWFRQGNNFGIYRKEKILHPITKVELGSPEVMIASGSFIRLSGQNGVLDIIDMETNINKGDFVKFREQTARSSGPRRTAKSTVGKKIDLQSEAEYLTQEILRIQDDIDDLKTFSNKINSIEKSLSSQRRITNALRKDINDIKGKLDILIEGGGVGSLIPSQTTMELYGAHPEKAKSLKINYADGINVKVQYQDEVLWVSLDVDSGKAKSKTKDIEQKKSFVEEGPVETAEDEEIIPLSELLDEKPSFLKKYLFHILGGLVVLGGGFFAFSFLKKKGTKKKPAGVEIDEFSEAEEEIEEVEEEEDF